MNYNQRKAYYWSDEYRPLVRRFNPALAWVEYGFWYIGRFGSRLWKHVELATETDTKT